MAVNAYDIATKQHLEEGGWLPFLRYIFFQTNLQSHKYYGYEPARKYKKFNIKYVEKKSGYFLKQIS